MKPEKEKMRLKFVYDDGSEFLLPISKFTTLRKDVPQVILHVDQLKDGSHLVIMNESIMPVDENRKLKGKLKTIEVVRE